MLLGIWDPRPCFARPKGAIRLQKFLDVESFLLATTSAVAPGCTRQGGPVRRAGGSKPRQSRQIAEKVVDTKALVGTAQRKSVFIEEILKNLGFS